ncbi:putative RNA-binding protein YlmH [Paenibacillus baekrokdamisoli]|uniref:Putative RNA-binding protein YlmH n=1 Tax=Paenibacillus baekrokdamisoli TaxID=1712516 RepID=A0A3G9IQR3_9BACL|nr:YlmH/Sll1252 family protein [Paenibacillus baekrokdamisoli]MBB3070194.1 RNA-binding protein YlmH [Paenibacillus baekrokdamisoli]BBH21200.1 putative RNA-binding protein YlmH [Paenibacillus baekrokdamisoli]
MKPELYVHFHPDEKPFVDRATEWIERAAFAHELKRTDFLDPRQADILISLANRRPEVQVKLFGGYEGAERKRAIVAPDYRMLDDEPEGIALIKVTSGTQGHLELDHGDYLGALLGLGIKRDRVGDLHIHEDFAHCLAAEEIADYINIQLRQVHRASVLTDIIPLQELQPVISAIDELGLSVASLRLDGIASDVYRVSRAKIVDPIRAGRCRVNWKVEEDPSASLKEGDVVSMQGLGRFKVLTVEGVSKKGRIRLKVGKFI